MKFLLALLLLIPIARVHSQVLDPVPSKLTHLFYTPTPYVNSQNSLVLGLHEISYSLDGNLALQMSLLGSIGHVDFGAKYQLASELAVGGGLAGWFGRGHSDFGHIDYGSRHVHHGHHHHGRGFGVFLTGSLAGGGGFTSAYTLHSQIGSGIAVGLDIGGIQQFSPMWSLILEAGSSFDVTGPIIVVTGTGGVRIVPPALQYLFIDLGITPLAVSFGNVNGFGGAGIYIDIAVALDLN